MGVIEDIIDMMKVKVIFNTRDPRAIYSSRKVLEHFTQNITLTKVKTLCVRLIHDIQIYNRLNETHRPFIYHTSYDDILTGQADTVKQLYDWLGVSVPPETLEEIVHASFTTGGRRFPKERKEQKWRRLLPRSDIKLIQRECKWVINQLGHTNIYGA